jgi:hypothetical protein
VKLIFIDRASNEALKSVLGREYLHPIVTRPEKGTHGIVGEEMVVYPAHFSAEYL